MKKTRIIAMVMAALIALSATSFAAGITEANIKDLRDFNIITGDQTGNLRLEDTLSRAEAAKIICVTMDGAEDAESLKSFPSMFSDVPNNHWAYGYVAYVQRKNVMAGYGNKIFGPSDKVTYVQFAKMLVCALGYHNSYNFQRDIKNSPDLWAMHYFSKAYALGLFKNTNFEAQHAEMDAPITREDVGIMICNALDIPIMKEVTKEYANGGGYKDGEIVPDKTLRIILGE